MWGIWGRGRQQSQGMSKSPRSFPAIFVEEEQENCQNQATQPHLQNAHACAHTHRLQSSSLRDERVFQPGACWLHAALGSKGHCAILAPAGQAALGTSRRGPSSNGRCKSGQRGASRRVRRRNPAVLLITSGCEKTEPQGSPKLSWQRDSSKRRSSLESRRAFVGYRERWWGRIPYKSVFSLVTISSPPNSNREMGVWLIISYHLQRPPDMALDSESHLRALKRPSETT